MRSAWGVLGVVAVAAAACGGSSLQAGGGPSREGSATADVVVAPPPKPTPLAVDSSVLVAPLAAGGAAGELDVSALSARFIACAQGFEHSAARLFARWETTGTVTVVKDLSAADNAPAGFGKCIAAALGSEPAPKVELALSVDVRVRPEADACSLCERPVAVRSERARSPILLVGATTTSSGRLAPEVIQRVLRQNAGQFRLCYSEGLKKNPQLSGKVVLTFRIARDGSVENVTTDGSDLSDKDVLSCITKALKKASFPKPEGGTVKVVYPLALESGSGDGQVPIENDKHVSSLTAADLEKNLSALGFQSEIVRGSGGGATPPFVLFVKRQQAAGYVAWYPQASCVEGPNTACDGGALLTVQPFNPAFDLTLDALLTKKPETRRL
ncbi:MAG: AgmX/PglI C-terminal domain-containing protein [Polyangiaceae bacterium]